MQIVAFFIPSLRIQFMGSALVFMLLYLWSREYADRRVSIMGLVTLQVQTKVFAIEDGFCCRYDVLLWKLHKLVHFFHPQGFYLPLALVLLDTIFGSPAVDDLLGILVGHFTTSSVCRTREKVQAITCKLLTGCILFDAWSCFCTSSVTCEEPNKDLHHLKTEDNLDCPL